MSTVTPSRPGEAAPADSGTTETKGPGRPRVEKIDFPLPEGGLVEWPADFDSSVHKPLKVEDFAKQGAFYRHKAALYEKRAKEFYGKANIADQFGTEEERKTAEKYLKFKSVADEMLAQMTASGVAPEALQALIASMEK
jgi:hypothetical protein